MRLLLVEPHALLAKALKWGLEEEGFAVEAVGTREGADGWVREGHYGLILVDLPADAGLDALRRWRDDGVRGPVLVFLNPRREVGRRLEPCGESFTTLTKPFGLDDLLTRVRTLVAGHGQPQREA